MKCGICKQDNCIPGKPYCETCFTELRLTAQSDQAKAAAEKAK